MEILIGVILVIGKLVAEHIATRQANKYADTVVRRYE